MAGGCEPRFPAGPYSAAAAFTISFDGAGSVAAVWFDAAGPNDAAADFTISFDGAGSVAAVWFDAAGPNDAAIPKVLVVAGNCWWLHAGSPTPDGTLRIWTGATNGKEPRVSNQNNQAFEVIIPSLPHFGFLRGLLDIPFHRPGGVRRIQVSLPFFSTPWVRLAVPGRNLNEKAVDLERGRNRDLVSWCYEAPILSAVQQIFIRSTEGRHFCLPIWGSMRVLELKKKIQDKLGIPVAFQILIFAGICMQEHHTLQHYRVAKDSTIILNHRLRGGAKGSTSKPTGTYRDAAKGKEPQKGKEPAAVNISPGQYIVDQMPESASISLDIPEVKCIFPDLEKNAVICRINGFWPRTEALYEWIHTVWTKNCQIHLCSKGFFIVVFLVDEEKEKILSEGPWFWGSAGLFVTPWFQEFDANTMVVSRMPVWVRLHNLPIHFWHFKTLSAIGNTLGRMLKIDTDRHLKGIFTFARICVEVDLSQGLPESIILNFNNIQWKQPLDYENTAFRCRGCQQTGHLLKECPSKSKPQQRKHKGWQNLDEVLKRRTARKKAPSVTEEKETEVEEDDTTIEEVEIEH